MSLAAKDLNEEDEDEFTFELDSISLDNVNSTLREAKCVPDTAREVLDAHMPAALVMGSVFGGLREAGGNDVGVNSQSVFVDDNSAVNASTSGGSGDMAQPQHFDFEEFEELDDLSLGPQEAKRDSNTLSPGSQFEAFETSSEEWKPDSGAVVSEDLLYSTAGEDDFGDGFELEVDVDAAFEEFKSSDDGDDACVDVCTERVETDRQTRTRQPTGFVGTTPRRVVCSSVSSSAGRHAVGNGQEEDALPRKSVLMNH